ncbi:MAG: hypothetical protein ACK5TR_03490 [Alphaproteobacteria bacterium]|jgi:hypothetical protein|nr:hypothetical protein [Alphaproteobacteria bacterium]
MKELFFCIEALMTLLQEESMLLDQRNIKEVQLLTPEKSRLLGQYFSLLEQGTPHISTQTEIKNIFLEKLGALQHAMEQNHEKIKLAAEAHSRVTNTIKRALFGQKRKPVTQYGATGTLVKPSLAIGAARINQRM